MFLYIHLWQNDCKKSFSESLYGKQADFSDLKVAQSATKHVYVDTKVPFQ